MSAHTRITLVGTRRRVDVVLPSAEPLGVLLPEFLRMTNEPHTAPPAAYQVVGTDGTALPDDRSLGESAVPDGSVLRVLRREDTPSAPVVHDVADATTVDLDARAWRWNLTARRWACTAVAVVAVVAALAVLVQSFRLSGTVPLALVALGSVVARRGDRPTGVALVLAGGFGGIFLALHQVSLIGVAWLIAAAIAGVVIAVLGLVSELGRGGVFGGAATLALVGLQAGLVLLELPGGRGAAIVAMVCLLALGALPRIALVASGLAGLDDTAAHDGEVRRPEVEQALAAAHRGLTIATIATGVAAAVAGAALALGTGPWTLTLACLVGAALLLRLRAFPLLAQVCALIAAASVVVGALFVKWLHNGADAQIAVCSVLAAIALGALLWQRYQPKEHVRARFRQLADRVELTVMIAVVPVVIGEFGIYGRLLATF